MSGDHDLHARDTADGLDEESPLASLPPGAIIEDKYRVISTLGRGAMGIVLLVEDLPLERRVALKMIAPVDHPLTADTFRLLFRREAAAMAAIRHANVAQVHAYGEHDGAPFFVMEYVPGQSLQTFIDHHPRLAPDVALGVLRQMCAGLDAIHAQGIVHRDIKPGNVIIGPQYRVCIVDFGVARPRADGTVELVGTPPYIAPEVLEGREVAAAERHLGDVYAAGVCAFELLTGALPFDLPEEISAVAAMLRQLTEPPRRLSALRDDLPPGFDTTIARALAKEPGERPASAGELFKALWEQREAVARDPSEPLVLIVDDDPSVRTLFRTIVDVAVSDVEVQTAGDGLVALELARARQPALILLDLNMPQVNGLELCAIIRGTPELNAVPIIVISAELTAETRGLLEGLGVAESLAKPIDPRQLSGAVQRQLARR